MIVFKWEEWRPVVGMERDYSVSNIGRVRGEERKVPGKLGSIRTLPQRLMSPTSDSSGYLQVTMHSGGRKSCRKVAHLVAAAFIGPRPDGHQVCHNDGRRQNNRVENLRYDTPEGNCADKLTHGTHARGARSGMAKLTADQVAMIRTDPRGCRAIGRVLGVHHQTVSNVRRNVSWRPAP